MDFVPRITAQYQDVITPEEVKRFFAEIGTTVINRYRPPSNRSQ